MNNQKNKELRDALFPDCPIRNVLSRVGDKWSLLVLYSLQHREPVRFKELQRQIPEISQKSLTQTLRTLEVDGFVTREVFPEVPPRVEYSLTPRALSFLPLVENMIKWATENMEEIIKDREKNVWSSDILRSTDKMTSNISNSVFSYETTDQVALMKYGVF